ncbi:MAG: hypothetical protein J6Y33_00115 [Prevotella sp.]|nr:hypothetical protein [Prevotella sp.]
MKNKILFTTLALMSAVLMAGASSAPDDNELQPIVTIVKHEHAPEWYARQAALWKAETERNPADDDAWINYYHATRYASWNGGDGVTDTDNFNRQLDAIVEAVTHAHPGSYAQYVLENFNQRMTSTHKPYDDHMEEAIRMRPDNLRLYPDYVVYLMAHGNEELLGDILRRWYESGEYSPTLLGYAYNELIGMEPDGIIFVNGDVPTFSKLIVGKGKGLFPDITVVTVSLLWDDTYRHTVCRTLGIDDYAPYREGDMKAWEEGFMLHIIRHTGRTAYFSSMMPIPSFNDRLYSEGLVYRYSEHPYDNLSMKKRNFEQGYLTDYLYEPLYPETYGASAQRLNLNYIPCLKSLLDYYKTSGDKQHYTQLYNLMKRIVWRAQDLTDDERKKYHAEIER